LPYFFEISEIIISDITNNYFRYQKTCFLISQIIILDIQNNYLGYPKNGINVNSAWHSAATQCTTTHGNARSHTM